MDAQWSGARWNIESLYPDRARWPAIVADPAAYLRELDAEAIVLPAGEGVGVTPLTRALRDVLEGRVASELEYERALELPAEARPEPSGLEGLDTPHFTYFVSTAHWFGPQLVVYRRVR